jgi:hypothetical protein
LESNDWWEDPALIPITEDLAKRLKELTEGVCIDMDAPLPPDGKTLLLSEEDQCLLAETLINPPKPNDSLKKAKILWESLVDDS